MTRGCIYRQDNHLHINREMLFSRGSREYRVYPLAKLMWLYITGTQTLARKKKNHVNNTVSSFNHYYNVHHQSCFFFLTSNNCHLLKDEKIKVQEPLVEGVQVTSSKSRKQKSHPTCSERENCVLVPMRNLPVGEGAAAEGRQEQMRTRIYTGDSGYTDK